MPDRSAPEIEITPEMIEAGALELKAFSKDYFSFEDGVIAIYRSMREIRNFQVSSRDIDNDAARFSESVCAHLE